MIKVTIGVMIKSPIGEELVVDKIDNAEWTNIKIPIGEAEKCKEEISYY